MVTDTRDMTAGEAETYARGRRDGYAEAIRDYGAKWGAVGLTATQLLILADMAEAGSTCGGAEPEPGCPQCDAIMAARAVAHSAENARARPAEAAAAPGGGGLPAGAAKGAGGREIGVSVRAP